MLPELCRTILGTERAKDFRQRTFSEPSPRAPAPGSTSAAAGVTPPPLLSGVKISGPQLRRCSPASSNASQHYTGESLSSALQREPLRLSSLERRSVHPELRRTFFSTEHRTGKCLSPAPLFPSGAREPRPRGRLQQQRAPLPLSSPEWRSVFPSFF
jgi:hypothetical protein